MIITVVNRSKKITDAEILKVIRAINRQIKEDFEPYWSLTATLRLEGVVGSKADTAKLTEMRGDAVLYLADKADVADALGYHDKNNRGIPYGFVFKELCDQLKEEWSVTLSHEALELIGDSQGNLLVQGPHPEDPKKEVFHWFEMCDAVQSLTYEIDGVKVSDFVLPLYFTPGEQAGGRNDFLGSTGLRSFGISKGGYIGYYDPATKQHETHFAKKDSLAETRAKLKAENKFGRGYVRKRSDATMPKEEAHARAIDPIKHIVVLMMENRSFDHMLGDATKIYPDLEGIPQSGPKFSNTSKDGQTYSLKPRARGTDKPYPKDWDAPHEFADVKIQLGSANNPMGGFVDAYLASEAGQKYPDMAGEIMSYYAVGDTPAQDSLPALHALARNFLVCDHWYSSMPGPTWPNRFFIHSGTCLGRVLMPTMKDPGPLLPPYNQDTIYDRLSAAKKNWRIYHDGVPQSLVLQHMWLQYGISLITDRYADMDDLEKDVKDEASFPEYVFIEPNYGFLGEIGNDQHPPSDVLRGDQLIARVYKAIRSNEALWQSTLLIITYDEHGGFYDHVTPPATVAPDSNNPDDFKQLGLRVPTILVSPWVDKGVCSTPFDHTSVLRYACDKWGMEQLSERAKPSAGAYQANTLLPELLKRSVPRTDTPKTIPPASATGTVRGRMAASALPLQQGNTQPMQGAHEALAAFLATLPDKVPAPGLHAAAFAADGKAAKAKLGKLKTKEELHDVASKRFDTLMGLKKSTTRREKKITFWETTMFNTKAWQDLLFPGSATDFFARREFLPFDPEAKGFSPANALWLAELCRLVYRHDVEENNPPPSPTRSSFLAGQGFKQLGFFQSEKTNSQGMLVASTGAKPFAVLVFRGTEQTPKDMLTDVKVGRFPLDEQNRDVHDGFQKAFDSIWCEVAPALKQLPDGLPLFYTGHSLGAALATLAAEKHKPRAVYTFGSPRVGNQLFVNGLTDIPFYRVVDDKDVVTTLPPEKMGFRHVGELHRLTAPTTAIPHQYFDPPRKLADHAPVNYVDRI